MKSNKLYNKAAKVFALIPFTLCLLLLLAACSNDNLSDLQLAGNCAVESIELDGKYTGVVDRSRRSVAYSYPNINYRLCYRNIVRSFTMAYTSCGYVGDEAGSEYVQFGL